MSEWRQIGGRYWEVFKLLYERLSGITSPAAGQEVTKIGFWEDTNGNTKYIKFQNGENVLYTLAFSNAGEAAAETWSITRL